MKKEADDDVGTPTTDETAQEIQSALDELGSSRGSCVLVYRQDEVDGFCGVGRIPLEQFDPWQLPQRFGGGLYRFQFRDSQGKVRRTIQQRFAAPMPSSTTIGAAPDQGGHAAFLEKLVLAFVSRPPQSAAGGITPADLLAAIAAGQKSSGAGGSTASELFEALRFGVELQGNRAEDPPSMMERLAPRVLTLLDNALATPRTAPAPALAAVPSSGVETIAAAPDIQQLVGQWAPRLISEAQSGRDPFTWGCFMGERIPVAWREVLSRFVTLTAIERSTLIARLAPAAIPFEGWIEEAVGGLRSVLFGEDDGDEATTSPDDAVRSAAAAGG